MKVAILGAGASGKSAAKLSNYLNIDCILSDSNSDVDISDLDEVQVEVGGHSDKILLSDLIVKSPGIPNNSLRSNYRSFDNRKHWYPYRSIVILQ